MLDGHGQRLHGRPLGHADLHEAQQLVPDWLALACDLRAALPVIWTRLLGKPGFSADVIEDLDRPEGQRLVGMGMAVALDNRWQQRLAVDPPAWVGAQLYAELKSGHFVPPDDKALAQLNARGEVSYVVLHYHQLHRDLGDANALETLRLAMDLFRVAHAGYRLQNLYQEGLGEQGDYLKSMGFRARTQRVQPGVPELYGLSRDEAMRQLPGTPVRDVFQFTPPRFGFSGSERRLLRLAVRQLTDEQIGAELGLSLHGIKKLWRSIHQRALDAMPQLFDEPAVAEGTRGPEKRRMLLQYLRQRAEELRPYARPAHTAAEEATRQREPQALAAAAC